jgi:hypothetical protein
MFFTAKAQRRKGAKVVFSLRLRVSAVDILPLRRKGAKKMFFTAKAQRRKGGFLSASPRLCGGYYTAKAQRRKENVFNR